MLGNILLQVLDTFRANRLRTCLTMFGIAWGIMSLVLMHAVGEGFRIAQYEGLRELGKDIMIVWGGRTSVQRDGFQAGRQVRLRFSDYEAVRRKGTLLEMASPEIIRNDLVTKSVLNSGAFGTHGVLPEYQYMRSIEMEWGRRINEADDRQRRTVCIIGSDVNDQLFRGGRSVGEKVSIGGHPFTVIGVMAYKEQNNSYSGQDRRDVFMPYRTMAQLFPDPTLGQSRHYLDNLILMPVNGDAHEAAERQVREILAAEHTFDPVDQDATPIWNTAKQSRMMDRLFRSMQLFLGAVALVTLALGAIGVVNIMLISVRERTVEIGLRKSLGARGRDILLQFFVESGCLAGVSGLLGLGLGFSICHLVNSLVEPNLAFAGMIVTPQLAVLACLALGTIAIVSGVYPAMTAARMDPVEALRFEAN